MSSECEDCGKHILDCECLSSGRYVLAHICGKGCPCQFKEYDTHLNLVRKDKEEGNRFKHLNPKLIGLVDGEDPPAEMPKVKYINVRGREEHEAILKDPEWCRELGLDQAYEIIVYLKRWGSWLRN